MKILTAETPEEIDNWPCPTEVFTGKCDGCDWVGCRGRKDE